MLVVAVHAPAMHVEIGAAHAGSLTQLPSRHDRGTSPRHSRAPSVHVRELAARNDSSSHPSREVHAPGLAIAAVRQTPLTHVSSAGQTMPLQDTRIAMGKVRGVRGMNERLRLAVMQPSAGGAALHDSACLSTPATTRTKTDESRSPPGTTTIVPMVPSLAHAVVDVAVAELAVSPTEIVTPPKRLHGTSVVTTTVICVGLAHASGPSAVASTKTTTRAERTERLTLFMPCTSAGRVQIADGESYGSRNWTGEG